MLVSPGKTTIKICYLIVEWEKIPEADKTELTQALNNSPEPTSDTSYYHSDDRWNGSNYAGAAGSFWSNYLAARSAAGEHTKQPRCRAIRSRRRGGDPHRRHSKTNPQVERQRHGALRGGAGGKARNGESYTPLSWAAYEAAIGSAESLLASLYYQPGDEIPPESPSATRRRQTTRRTPQRSRRFPTLWPA
jgi:hypothetical protein